MATLITWSGFLETERQTAQTAQTDRRTDRRTEVPCRYRSSDIDARLKRSRLRSCTSRLTT